MSGFDVFQTRLTVTGQILVVTPLKIGAGSSANVIGSDNPVMKDSLGQPIIPGSSLKGAMRAYLEAFLQALQSPTTPRLVCDIQSSPTNNVDESCLAHLKENLSRTTRPDNVSKADVDTDVVSDSCLACRVFGSPWIAAKLSLRDLAVSENGWNQRYVFRDGVSIDRETGTAADKRKYDFEAVPVGTRFDFKMQVENADEMEKALALIAVKALEGSHIQLGGSRSRGTGWCRLVNTEYAFYNNPLDVLLGLPAQGLTETDVTSAISAFRPGLGPSHA